MFLRMLKNDLKGAFRYYLIAGIIIFVTALLLTAFIPVEEMGAYDGNLINYIFSILMIFMLGSIVCFAGILGSGLSLSRLLKAKLFSREAYLTLTLPLSTRKNVLSKLVAIAIWSIAIGLFSILCISVAYFSISIRLSIAGGISLSEIVGDMNIFIDLQKLTAKEVGEGIYYFFFIISIATSFLIMSLLSLAISQLKFFRNNKIIFGIITAVVFFVLISIASRLTFNIQPVMLSANISLGSLITFIFFIGFTIGGFYFSCYLIDYKIEMQ